MRVFIAAPKHPPLADERALDAIADAVLASGHEIAHAQEARGERAAFESIWDALKGADVVVAEASQPSLGVGWILSQQLAMGRLAIVCVREDARARLNTVIAGNPSPWQRVIAYAEPADLSARLASLLG